jgi:hypothetical protein
VACLSLAGVQRVEAAAKIHIEGEVVALDETLDVRIALSNSGDAAASQIRILASLNDVEREAEVSGELPPGGTRRLRLAWPVPQRGTHPVMIRLTYHDAAHAAELQQPAWLLAAVERAPPPAVSVVLPEELVLRQHVEVPVTLASLDFLPHTVALRFGTPDGLSILGPPGEVAVPAEAEVVQRIRLLRGGAPTGSVQGLVVAATTTDGDSVTTAVATMRVDVRGPTRWTERLRLPAVVVALILLLGATVLEALRYRSRRREGANPSPTPHS